MEKERIKLLYALYGFVLYDEKSDYLIFTHTDGYFHNAVLLRLKPDAKTDSVREELEEVGFSVKISNYSNYDDLHKELFSGFFSRKLITKRLAEEYNRYCDLQAKKLGCPSYRFVPCRYISDNNSIEKDIVSYIYSCMFNTGAQLIIVEAAAGYGKTSIAYELIRKLSNNARGTVPIITELSKNRRAQIFKYVLLSEIDSKFSGLSSSVVEAEIKNGNVPLIIDGFDELLSKSSVLDDNGPNEDSETAQTMLATISELLVTGSNAKIVLTSRKSSIFAGELFEEWANHYLPNCEITRLQVVPPKLSDWLGREQRYVLLSKNINLEHISNPTLLTFLSTKTPEELDEGFNSVDDILNQYFDILLKRERERQELRLTVDEQLGIMKKVAFNMAELNETAFSADDLSVIWQLIITEEELDTYISRYDLLDTIPKAEEFYAKLSHHALLDRIPNTSNLIGFINDFIFGYLLAEVVIAPSKDISVVPSIIADKYWDLMITAYAVCSIEKRKYLYKAMLDSGIKFNSLMMLNADILLSREINRKYKSNYFESINFPPDTLINSHSFENCTFSCCIFHNCKIFSDAFVSCKFYGCQFYEIEIVQSPEQYCNLLFSNCTGESPLLDAANRAPTEIVINEDVIFERKVLEQYWRPGSDHADRRRLYDTLFRGNNQQDYANIAAAIERLYSKEILKKKNNIIELDLSKIVDIREILGR